MAKQTSVIRLQGTFKDVTFVSSGAYGDHTRAPRGTHKTAMLNASCEQTRKSVLSANVPSKIFKDAIDPYRGNMLGGTLWSRLVSFFNKQVKTHGQFDFTTLPPFDIHENFPLRRFMSLQSRVSVDLQQSTLQIAFLYDDHPTFKKVKSVDGYQFTVIGVYPDLVAKKAHTTAVTSAIHKFTDPLAPSVFQLTIPPDAKAYIICVKLDGCAGSEVWGTRATTALCAIDAGTL